MSVRSVPARRLLGAWLLAATTGVAASCDSGGSTDAGGTPSVASATDLWPTTDWASGSPESVGLDPAVLAALDAEFAAGQHGYVDGMLIVRRGRLVFERTYTHDHVKLFAAQADQTRGPYNYYDPEWHPYYRDTRLHTMQSVSKSVTSALVGIAIARGQLPGVDAKVMPYFTDFRSDDDPRRQAMTLEHVLTMTTGIRWDESTVAYTDPANSCAGMEQSQDWIQFVLDQPMATDPGSAFVYNSGATQLLSEILRKATGAQVHDYAAEHLFTPLGIDEFYWKRTPTGLADTEGGLYLTARDLARFGYLYLRDGMWAGDRLLPEGWVAASVRPLVDTGVGRPATRKYGYKWWLLPRDAAGTHAFAALGYGGQLAIGVPELDLLAVFTGWNIYDRPSLSPQLALERVLASVRDGS
jgi:CubicO group peptidase (beta-lactamase class C family)